MKKHISFLPLIVFPFILSACPWINPSVGPNDIASIELTHSEVLIGLQQSIEIKATGYTESRTVASEQAFTWALTDESVVEFAAHETSIDLTAIKVGKTTLKCFSTKNNRIEASATIEVTDKYVPQKVALNETYKDYISHNIYTISSAPTKGKAKILIVPVWFTDSNKYITNANHKKNVLDDIETAYLGTQEATGWHSVKSYYEAESRGALTLDGFVTDWYECNMASTEMYKENEDNTKTPNLVRSAYTWYKKTYGSSNIKDFDCDNDGFIDSIMLIYAAPDSRVYDHNNGNMWAYCFWTGDNANISSPNVNVFFWASYDFMYNETTAYLRTGTAYGGGDSSHNKIDAHTFIHEMGHVFGAEDYYDYSSQYNPAAGFSMQDMNVAGHDPYTRIAYGWDNPYIPTESCKMTVSTYESTGDVVLLSSNPSSFSNSPFDEYILLELYSPTGLNEFDHHFAYRQRYPTGASEVGFRIWHVDARLLDLRGISDESQIDESRIVRGVGNKRGLSHAMSNTYYKENAESNAYVTLLGEDYADYNILQLIRNNKFSNYHPTDDLANTSLFRQGSEFTTSTYYKQFVNAQSMNDGSTLDWKVKVESIRNGSATITLTRL